MDDNMKIEIIKKIKIKKAILESLSFISVSELNKLLSVTLIGLTSLYISWYEILSSI